jgi:hypothetical protein
VDGSGRGRIDWSHLQRNKVGACGYYSLRRSIVGATAVVRLRIGERAGYQRSATSSYGKPRSQGDDKESAHPYSILRSIRQIVSKRFSFGLGGGVPTSVRY